MQAGGTIELANEFVLEVVPKRTEDGKIDSFRFIVGMKEQQGGFRQFINNKPKIASKVAAPKKKETVVELVQITKKEDVQTEELL